MSYLEDVHNKLLKLWESRRDEYEEHLDSQQFKRDADQAEAWIAAQDALMKDVDFGVREIKEKYIVSLKLIREDIMYMYYTMPQIIDISMLHYY